MEKGAPMRDLPAGAPAPDDPSTHVRSTALSRRTMLRSGGLLAALSAAGLTAAACTSEKEGTGDKATPAAAGDGPQKGKKVIFVVHDKNPFFAPVEAGFKAFGAVMGWETQFTGPPAFDAQATVDMQTNALNAKPAGVIFTRVDTSAFDANIKRAQTEGIKVILSNVASDGYEKLGVGFVGQSFVPAGEVCGMEIAKYVKQKTGRSDGLILAGNISPGNSALEQRIEGTERGVQKYNQANGTNYRVEPLVTSTDEAKAVGVIDARYARDRDSVVGWAMSAFDHQYVATWSKSKNLVGKFAVGGFDLVAPVLDGIEAGTIDFSLGQNPYAQGWIAAALLAMQIDPGFPAGSYDTGAEVVDKSTVKVAKQREARFA